MKISFDLDDTITGYIGEKEIGQRGFINKIKFKEPIRAGTRELFSEIKNLGHEIIIYTTSHRTHKYIEKWFKSYEIKIDGVINGEDNKYVINGRNITKNPDAFDIDIHFDNEEIVCDKNENIKSKIVIIDVNDTKWTEKIRNTIFTQQVDAPEPPSAAR